MKPEITHELKDHRPIGAQRGFAATFNWMLNFCRNLTGGPGVTVDRTDSDHPIIRIGDANATRAPFACRFHKTEDDETGKWEIWMPPGCVSVGGPCEAINAPTAGVSGHEDDADGWGLICFWDSPTYWNQYAPARTFKRQVPDGSGGTTEVTVYSYAWSVVVHAKTAGKTWQADGPDAPARRLCYASARPLRVGGAGRYTQAELDEMYWDETRAGDEFAFEVGRITFEQWVQAGAVMQRHAYEHLRRIPLDLPGRAPSNLDLEWYYAVDAATGRLTCEKVYCRRIEQAAAGMTVRGPDYVDVTGAEATIYARIDVNGAGENVMDVVMDPDDVAGGDLVTWLHLYDVKDNRVTADYRASSLVNVQVFR